ncbi:MAG TPA: lysophospholipid acyltransferase family protein [Burkholderiaceae bacterium]|nr:lysophospholipid acyltransferase family protein [Burkholderiaceae bacterium]
MVIFLARLLARLPLPLLHAIGGVGGWIVYGASATYRRRLRANLQQAGLDAHPVRHAAIAAAGRQALEMPWVWMRPAADIARVARIEDVAGFRRFVSAPGAVVLLTPHLGCFEIIAQHYMLQPWAAARPMTALYRVPRKAALRPLLEGARGRNGLQLAPADLRGVRLLMRALRQGGVAGILPDQVPSQGDGVWAPFFGRSAYTMTLPARLAQANGARVALMHAERLPRGRGFVIRWNPIAEPFRGDAAGDAALLNRHLEELIRRLPAQYLWGYNRYKVPAGVAAPAPGEGAAAGGTAGADA